MEWLNKLNAAIDYIAVPLFIFNGFLLIYPGFPYPSISGEEE